MIDTHLHLWQLSRGWYGWNTPALGAVHADSDIAAIADEMVSAGVTGGVVVQAADTTAETDWLLSLARTESAILGVVGYLPLNDVTEVERLLSAYQDAPLVGVRQLWHDHARGDELSDPKLAAGLAAVERAGLAVDVPDAYPTLWAALVDAADQSPGIRFVLDHCGKPPFGDARAWKDWEARFTDLAARPNVVVKLSGLFGGSGSATAATEDELTRVVELARSAAGGDRTMIGSDWPMSRGGLGYAAAMDKLDRLLGTWSAEERASAMTGTARRTYRLG